jgi:hypothetical protein
MVKDEAHSYCAESAMSLFGVVFRKISEIRAHQLTYDQIYARMQQSGDKLANKMRSAPTNSMTLERARHIIGIERWGQARLKTFLGGPALHDEYDGYRPDDLTTMPALADAMANTRAETLRLIEVLKAAGASAGGKVAHNELGDIDARSWLIYLDDHATREGMVIR